MLEAGPGKPLSPPGISEEREHGGAKQATAAAGVSHRIGERVEA